MPFLHLDSTNLHKEAWRELVKDHPAGFEVLEWTTEQDRNHLRMALPEIDTQLFPRYCISVIAAVRKLLDYGGIVVRGENVAPIRGINTILEDWKTLGPPRRLTVRGYGYPIFVDRSTIMTCAAGDTVCAAYCEQLVQTMVDHKWVRPKFDVDVAIM